MPSAPTTNSGLREWLKDLRAEWKAYNRADYQHGGPLSHIDYRLAACADRCGQCEGCYSERFRRERMAELAEQAAQLKRQLELDQPADPEPEPVEPKQLTLLP